MGCNNCGLQSKTPCSDKQTSTCRKEVRKDVSILYNQIRRESPSTGTFMLSWDPDVEKLAQDWTDRCIFNEAGSTDAETKRYLTTESE